MKFTYQARTKSGELQVGNVEAKDRNAATNILLGHELFVLNIESVVDTHWYDRVMNFFKRVNVKHLMIFTRQFSTLLSSQVPLSDGLANLYKQAENPVMKETIAEMKSDVEAGLSLSQSLEKHPQVFSEFYINMVKSAEVTGRLSEVLEFLADYLERQSILASKVKNAMVYPAFVIALFIVVMIIMIAVVLPQLGSVFAETSVELPLFTRMLLSLGNALSSWWWAFGIGFLALSAVIINYIQTKEGKVVLNELSLRLPVFGELFKKLYIARFAEAARVLIKGGLTIPQAIEISSRTVGNVVYQDLLHQAAESIRKGQLLSKAIAGMPEFPSLVSQLISVGESTGRLEQLLEKISSFYSREVEDMVDNLVTLIQPTLMTVIGIMVAILFASILLPLYNLSRAF